MNPQCLRTLVGVLLLLFSLQEVHAEETEPCDARSSLIEATRLMEGAKDAHRVLTRLDAGLPCAPDELKYRFYFYRALTLVQLGRIDEAVRDCRSAQEWSFTDEDSRTATDLEQVVIGMFSRVVFTIPDNVEVIPDVQIESWDEASLPDMAPLTALVSTAHQPYVERTLESILLASQRVLDAAAMNPLQVWLPRGTYNLDNGQIIKIDSGSGQIVVNVAAGISWPDASFVVAPSVMVTRRLGVASGEASTELLSLGLGVVAAHSLEVLAKTNVVAEATLMPGQKDQKPVELDPSGPPNWSLGEGWAMSFGLGLERPVVVGNRKVFLLPGVGLHTLLLTSQQAILTLDGTPPNLSGVDWTTNQGDLNWLGAGPAVKLRMHLRFLDKPTRKLDLTISGDGGVLAGLYLTHLEGLEVPEGEDNSEEGDLDSPVPGSYSAGETVTGLGWTATASLSVGMSLLF